MMAQNPNVNYNLYKQNIDKEFSKNPTGDMVAFDEEITISKTEIKEELCDYEMSVNNVESIYVKEEPNSLPENNLDNENLKFMSNEQALCESLVSGYCQLREEDIQKTQKLIKKRLYLKGNKAQRKNILKTHLLVKQCKSRRYKCANCKFATHKRQRLQRHVGIHTNDKPFKCTYKNCECIVGQEEFCKCDMCGYSAAQEVNLKSHILTKHSVERKRYKCTDCKYTTHLKNSLERHIRTHTNDRPFKCTYKNCECTAGQEESCKCDMCGYAAVTGSNLKRHILVKHSREPKKYKCADCKYTAHIKSDLERHIRAHANERLFKCTYKYCNCIAEEKESCKCNPCEYSATFRRDLNKHILKRHNT